MSFNSQRHAKRSITERTPVTDDTAVVTIPPPPKLRRPLWLPQVVHMGRTSQPRPLELQCTVPSFASDAPGPKSSTAAQQSAIRSTHPKYLGPCDPTVNGVNGTYSLPPDSAILLSGAELSLTPPTPSSKAKGAVKARSNNINDVSARTASIGSHLYVPESMGMQQISTGNRCSSSDGRRWMEGVSLPTSVVLLYY
jgi:hypothetical protein